ncbi:MAG: SRPBCC family protein [Candidatus Dormibacteraceae bacterium]
MGETTFVIEPGRQDIVMTRVFDAPRDLVYRAVTEPELIARWWGPRRFTTVIDRMEARPGGRWRWINKGADSSEHAFFGVHHAMSPEQIVRTFEYEGAPGHVSLETLTLDEVPGGTRYQTVGVFQSVTDRDMAVASGMEGGARETMDRLEETLGELR